MATYYFRKDGTAANKAAATGPASDPSHCMNLNIHNEETFSPGDNVMISGLGGRIRGIQYTPSPGVNYIGIDDAVISAANKVSGFAQVGAGNSKVDSYEVHDVFYQGVCRYDGSTDLPAMEWVAASKDMPLSQLIVWCDAAGDMGSADVWMEVWQDDGSGNPANATKIGESDHLLVTSLSGAPTPGAATFTFSTMPSLTNGTKYFFVMNGDWAVGANKGVHWAGHAEASANFDRWYQNGGTWTEEQGASLHIEIYEPTAGSGDVWYASLATNPSMLWIDNGLGDPKSALVDLVNNLDWWWDSGTNRLYLYSDGGDPDTIYTDPGVEYRVRNYCVQPTQDDCAWDNIAFRFAVYAGIFHENPGNDCTLSNCVFEWSRSGTELGAVGGTVPFGGWVVEDCVARWCAVTGFGFGYLAHDCTVRRCEAYQIDRTGYLPADPTWDWTAGIKVFGGTTTMEGMLFYENLIYDIGWEQAGEYQGRGVGIWLDAVEPVTPTRNQVYRNCVFNCFGNGIFVEISSYTDVYNNVLWDNGQAEPHTAGEFTPSNIAVDTRETYITQHNRVYNNTCYGGQVGIKLASYSQSSCRIDYNLIRNNIAVGASLCNLLAMTGGNNVTYGTGNVYERNCFGAEHSAFIRWGGTNYSTYDAWLAASGQADNNVEADPQLAAIGSDHYWLGAGSPCIGAGADLGSDFEDGLDSTSVWPGAVVTRTQGAAWDLGAFPYDAGGGAPGAAGEGGSFCSFVARKLATARVGRVH